MESSAERIAITSTAFAAGQPIPKKYTGDGEDLSPPLAWKDPPVGTRQWALIVDDPDAPTPEPWVHWLLYSLSADVRSLPEGIQQVSRPKAIKGALQGTNSWPKGENVGYRGPAPPKGHGVHHYHFKLYALNAELKLGPELTKTDLLKAIKSHVIGTGELIGTYERK